MLEPVRAEPGDVVDIRYASRGSLSGRGVVRYPDEASWAACDEAQAVTIAADRDAGGGCSNSSDFRCLRATTGVEVPITGAPGDAVYLACPGAHCSGGLKLRVDVVAGRASVPPGAPRDIIVPEWTDDFGFCSPIGHDLDDGNHRPHGLRDIVAYEGDTLVFKFSTHHNVWVAPSRGSYDDCAFDEMLEIASAARGECGNDDSLGPWGRHPSLATAELSPLDGYSGSLAALRGVASATFDGDIMSLETELTSVSGIGVMHLHEGTSCDDPGAHYFPAYDEDPWGSGGAGLREGPGSAAWSASGFVATFTITAGGFAFEDVVGRTVVVHDADGTRAACGVVQFEPSDEAWAHASCLRDATGYRYPLSLHDPSAVVVRDHPLLYGFGTTNAGGNNGFEGVGPVEGAVVLYFVCQVHDHCVNGQRVQVYVLPRLATGSGGDDDPGEFDDATEVGVLVFLLLVIVGLGAVIALLFVKLRQRPRAQDQLELQNFKAADADDGGESKTHAQEML